MVYSKAWELASRIDSQSSARRDRPRADGKTLCSGDSTLWVKGVTYGTFRPDDSGNEFHNPSRVENDLRAIASKGFNSIRTYTVPPLWLLDLASSYELRVMVGLPWEQHVAFLDSKDTRRKIRKEVEQRVRACEAHPAVLCYALGSEIPAPIARWYGPRKIERFLHELWSEAKSEDPEALFTYVNYPSTEYLRVDFADLFCFNVYLETRHKLESYIAHLHNLAGDRPLLLAEIGLDSMRNGERRQAEVLDWQVRTAFAAGCSGAFVFSWTDEWHRGGQDIADWSFGLTDRRRRPKAALETVSRALAETPFAAGLQWPRISVVVCSYNGSRTIRQCLDALQNIDYPNFEVIVVDDGSTDSTADIAREFQVRLISTANCGLSSARNTGLYAASGDIIAYIDDDAYPSPEWLRHLALTFMTTEYAAVGGPNLPPPSDGFIAECVAAAPGGPIHVLLSDREAEHIPGCNMAIRKVCLQAIGGFDTVFRVAGDDVDVCWRLQQYGWKLGFNAAAVVWHHRRSSVRGYWKQQRGYGKAEALLESKWPEKYNSSGHPAWAGRIYSPGLTARPSRSKRIFHGVWGGALFQSVYEPAPAFLSSVSLMPEWYLLIGVLSLLSGIGVLWPPLLAAAPVAAAAAGLALVQSVVRTFEACRLKRRRSRPVRFAVLGVTTLLHALQPLARLAGRLRHGLHPWRRRDNGGRSWAVPAFRTIWSENWRTPEEWLQSIETDLRKTGTRVIRGGEYDRWDLEMSEGTFGSVRLLALAEEHGAGRQFLRFRLTPRCPLWTIVAIAGSALLAGAAAWDGARLAAAILAIFPVACLVRVVGDTGLAMATAFRVLDRLEQTVAESNKPAEPPRQKAARAGVVAEIPLGGTGD